MLNVRNDFTGFEYCPRLIMFAVKVVPRQNLVILHAECRMLKCSAPKIVRRPWLEAIMNKMSQILGKYSSIIYTIGCTGLSRHICDP